MANVQESDGGDGGRHGREDHSRKEEGMARGLVPAKNAFRVISHQGKVGVHVGSSDDQAYSMGQVDKSMPIAINPSIDSGPVEWIEVFVLRMQYRHKDFVFSMYSFSLRKAFLSLPENCKAEEHQLKGKSGEAVLIYGEGDSFEGWVKKYF